MQVLNTVRIIMTANEFNNVFDATAPNSDTNTFVGNNGTNGLILLTSLTGDVTVIYCRLLTIVAGRGADHLWVCVHDWSVPEARFFGNKVRGQLGLCTSCVVLTDIAVQALAGTLVSLAFEGLALGYAAKTFDIDS